MGCRAGWGLKVTTKLLDRRSKVSASKTGGWAFSSAAHRAQRERNRLFSLPLYWETYNLKKDKDLLLWGLGKHVAARNSRSHWVHSGELGGVS